MTWRKILKVDVYFDKDFPYIGGYTHSQFADLEDMLNEGMGAFENIRINHHKIYAHLKRKLSREPTEKELIEYVKRVLMHEGAHAGHKRADDEFSTRESSQKEYIAYMMEFPESAYLALRHYITHPASREESKQESMLRYIFGEGKIKLKDAPKIMKELLTYVNRWAKTSKDKEKLLRLELVARKRLYSTQKKDFPYSYEKAKIRYGDSEFIRRLFKS